MNVWKVALWTIFRKEAGRVLRIWIQTLLPPVITMSLYFIIFGNLIGSQISDIGGYTSVNFQFGPKILRSYDLLLDWMKLEAFTPVFRSHEGILPDDTVEFLQDGSYEYVPCKNLDDRKLVYILKSK